MHIVSGDEPLLVPVLIIQPHWIGMWRVVDELITAGFERDVDFRLSLTSLGVEDYIIPGRRQLLVTDSWKDAPGAAEKFVAEMWERNPELHTAFFSPLLFSVKEASGFHQTISTANYGVLVETIRSFVGSRFL